MLSQQLSLHLPPAETRNALPDAAQTAATAAQQSAAAAQTTEGENEDEINPESLDLILELTKGGSESLPLSAILDQSSSRPSMVIFACFARMSLTSPVVYDTSEDQWPKPPCWLTAWVHCSNARRLE